MDAIEAVRNGMTALQVSNHVMSRWCMWEGEVKRTTLDSKGNNFGVKVYKMSIRWMEGNKMGRRVLYKEEVWRRQKARQKYLMRV